MSSSSGIACFRGANDVIALAVKNAIRARTVITDAAAMESVMTDLTG